MENIENEIPASTIADTNQDKPEQAEPGVKALVSKLLGNITETLGRWRNDRQAVTASLGRYSAHIAVISLAILLGVLGKFNFATTTAAESSESNAVASYVAAEPETAATVTTEGLLPATLGQASVLGQEISQPRALVRKADPFTIIPKRPRLDVITYTVQSGDAIFLIAERFDLSPYTVAWSNMEVLQGAPYLISPGLTLFIPPVDGAYHVVTISDTVSSIADYYEVPQDALYNEWNDLQAGNPLAEGMLLMVPGATGDEDIEWEAPAPEPRVGAASASYSYCSGTSVQGPGAYGNFILPTGSYAVSGWYFHDVRNPTHIGLDYRCRLGDPIVAADNGVVSFAGWSGGYGNLVKVDHGNGFVTYYAHFDSIAVTCGTPVYQGSYLGACGTTGWSSGPHLHYEIRQGGVPVNPQLFE